MKIIRSYLKLKFDLVFFFFFFYTFKSEFIYQINLFSIAECRIAPLLEFYGTCLIVESTFLSPYIQILKSVDIFKLYPIGPDSYDLKKNTNIFPKYGEKKMRIASLKRGGRHEIENNRWREQSFSSRYRKPIIRAGAFALIPLMGRQPPSLSLSLETFIVSSRDECRRRRRPST